MAGSLGLNKRFEDTVRRMIGNQAFENLKGSVGWAKAIKEFDTNIKTSFNGDVSEIYYINFPKADLEDNPEAGLFGNCWEMTG